MADEFVYTFRIQSGDRINCETKITATSLGAAEGVAAAHAAAMAPNRLAIVTLLEVAQNHVTLLSRNKYVFCQHCNLATRRINDAWHVDIGEVQCPRTQGPHVPAIVDDLRATLGAALTTDAHLLDIPFPGFGTSVVVRLRNGSNLAILEREHDLTISHRPIDSDYYGPICNITKHRVAVEPRSAERRIAVITGRLREPEPETPAYVPPKPVQVSW